MPPPPHGVTTYVIDNVTYDLFPDHHSIPEAHLENARQTRQDPRAQQNSRALYKCLKASITGDLKATLFNQDGNIPLHEDGPLLFKTLTLFTIAASLQLSMLSFKNILEFSSAEHGFNIPVINTKLNHLFVLATTRDRRLPESERIQHTLTVYARIKQPELWAQWVRNQVDFDAGLLTNCQAFMNAASLKFTKIASSDSGFEGRSTTVQEDIVAMVTKAAKKPKKDSSSASVASTATSTSPPSEKTRPTSFCLSL